jgi:hypothetical protein
MVQYFDHRARHSPSDIYTVSVEFPCKHPLIKSTILLMGCSRGKGGKGFKRKNEKIRHGLVHDSPGYACPSVQKGSASIRGRTIFSGTSYLSASTGLVANDHQTCQNSTPRQRQRRPSIEKRAFAKAGRIEQKKGAIRWMLRLQGLSSLLNHYGHLKGKGYSQVIGSTASEQGICDQGLLGS